MCFNKVTYGRKRKFVCPQCGAALVQIEVVGQVWATRSYWVFRSPDHSWAFPPPVPKVCACRWWQAAGIETQDDIDAMFTERSLDEYESSALRRYHEDQASD
jgi:hypothetical protein